MREYLLQFMGEEAAMGVQFMVALIAVLLLFGVFVWFLRLITGKGRRKPAQPDHRLAVLDRTQIDDTRSLLLVRRDDVEHLVMIGGPSDVVVEANIDQFNDDAEANAGHPLPGHEVARRVIAQRPLRTMSLSGSAASVAESIGLAAASRPEVSLAPPPPEPEISEETDEPPVMPVELELDLSDEPEPVEVEVQESVAPQTMQQSPAPQIVATTVTEVRPVEVASPPEPTVAPAPIAQVVAPVSNIPVEQPVVSAVEHQATEPTPTPVPPAVSPPQLVPEPEPPVAPISVATQPAAEPAPIAAAIQPTADPMPTAVQAQPIAEPSPPMPVLEPQHEPAIEEVVSAHTMEQDPAPTLAATQEQPLAEPMPAAIPTQQTEAVTPVVVAPLPEPIPAVIPEPSQTQIVAQPTAEPQATAVPLAPPHTPMPEAVPAAEPHVQMAEFAPEPEAQQAVPVTVTAEPSPAPQAPTVTASQSVQPMSQPQPVVAQAPVLVPEPAPVAQHAQPVKPVEAMGATRDLSAEMENALLQELDPPPTKLSRVNHVVRQDSPDISAPSEKQSADPSTRPAETATPAQPQEISAQQDIDLSAGLAAAMGLEPEKPEEIRPNPARKAQDDMALEDAIAGMLIADQPQNGTSGGLESSVYSASESVPEGPEPPVDNTRPGRVDDEMSRLLQELAVPSRA